MNSLLLRLLPLLVPALLALPAARADKPAKPPSPNQVLKGVRTFFARTAATDGSFRPGIDPAYEGMADTAYSDLAAATYAVVLAKTFGWKLPHEARTKTFFLSRQRSDGAFVNVKGTVDPKSSPARVYNTTQGLVALRALGVRPRYDPLPVFAKVLEGDYKKLPAYSSSFFPLAYRACGKRFPPKADRKLRKLMVPARDGYLHDHIAASFHAAHYYRLLGEDTPKADSLVRRTLRDQKADGSWMLNPLARDRHASYDAAFVLRQLGKDSAECKKALEKVVRWSLSCRNADGGFGHYPGSTSDADAVYFHVGTLVLAGFIKPVDPLPPDADLLGWGHLMKPRKPVRKKK
jgi:geranylgeranyl transferase type-2 subunit beta